MGKREVRVIVVPKRATLMLLLLASAAIIALLYFLSGKAYARDTYPVSELLTRIARGERGFSRDTVLAALMPVFANILLFVPWGFLTFVGLDTPARPRRRTYLITVCAGLAFAVALEVWQAFLPMRVTNPLDVLANTAGTLAGAVAGHLRKQVYVRFNR
jgi:VanZ family protein